MTDAGGTLELQTVADVLIVGAGPAGLTTAATFLNAGFNVVVLEQSPSVGGWLSDISSDTACTGPVESLLFSDANFTASLPFEPTAQDVRMYLAAYAQFYNVTDHIRLSCRVKHLAFDSSSGRWRAVFQDLSLGKRYQAAADFVILCAGHGLPEGGLLGRDTVKILEVAAGTAVLQANGATADGVHEAAAAAVTVVGDGDAAVDCASALALLRRGHGVGLVVQQPACGGETCRPSSAAAAAAVAPSSPSVPRVDGPSLLGSARRRALHAALQPHPSLPPPGAVGRALMAPTKRRFWAYVKGRAEAVVSRGGGGGDRRSTEPASQAAQAEGSTLHASPHCAVDPEARSAPSPAAADAQRRRPCHLVLWAPSFRDPRVMPFLDPDLRAALLQVGSGSPPHRHQPPEPSAAASSSSSAFIRTDADLVLYRGVVHPDVPGLAFVGWQSHASTRLLVPELQAQWLVALLTARLKPPRPSAADMRADMARQRTWRAAALASPLMSTHGSMARTHEQHYVRQLLADLDGWVLLREQGWDAGPGYASPRPLLASRDVILVPELERRHRGGGGGGGGTLGGCFGGGGGGGGEVRSSKRSLDQISGRSVRHSHEMPEGAIVHPLAPATPPASQSRAARLAMSFSRDSAGEQHQQHQNQQRGSSVGVGGGINGKGAKTLSGRIFARVSSRLLRRFSYHIGSPPVSPAASAVAMASGSLQPLPPPPPPPQQQRPSSSGRQPSRSSPTAPTTNGPSNRRSSASSIGSASGAGGSGNGGAGAAAGPRVTMFVPSPPIAPYLQDKLRNAVRNAIGSAIDLPAGCVGDGGGPRQRRPLSASYCLLTTPTPGLAAAAPGEGDVRRSARGRRHRASASAVILGACQRSAMSARSTDNSSSTTGDAAVAAAAAAAVTGLLERVTSASGSQGGRSAGGGGAGSPETREAELSARLHRVSQSTGVDLSTLVDLVVDDAAAPTSVLYVMPPRSQLPLPTPEEGSAACGDGCGGSGGGVGVGGGGRLPRRSLLARPSLDLHPLVTAVGFLEGETLDEVDCNAALSAGQRVEGPVATCGPAEEAHIAAAAAAAATVAAAQPDEVPRSLPEPEPLLRPRRAPPPPPPHLAPAPPSAPPPCSTTAPAADGTTLTPPLQHLCTGAEKQLASPFTTIGVGGDASGGAVAGAAATATAPADGEDSLEAQLAVLRAHLVGGASDPMRPSLAPPLLHRTTGCKGPLTRKQHHFPQGAEPGASGAGLDDAGCGSSRRGGTAPEPYRQSRHVVEFHGWSLGLIRRLWQRTPRRTLSLGEVALPRTHGPHVPATSVVSAAASAPPPLPPPLLPPPLLPPPSSLLPLPPSRHGPFATPSGASQPRCGAAVGIPVNADASPRRQPGPSRAASLGKGEMVGGQRRPRRLSSLRLAPGQRRAPDAADYVRTETTAESAADALSHFCRSSRPGGHRHSAPALPAGGTGGGGSGGGGGGDGGNNDDGGGSDDGSRPSTPMSPPESVRASRFTYAAWTPRGSAGDGAAAAAFSTSAVLQSTGSGPPTLTPTFRSSGLLAKTLQGLRSRVGLLESLASSGGGWPSGGDAAASPTAAAAAAAAGSRTWTPRWAAWRLSTTGGSDNGGGGGGSAAVSTDAAAAAATTRSRPAGSVLRREARALTLSTMGYSGGGGGGRGGVRLCGVASNGGSTGRTHVRRRFSLAHVASLMSLRGSDGGVGGGGVGGRVGRPLHARPSLGGMLAEAAAAAQLPYSKRLESGLRHSGAADADLGSRQSAPEGRKLLDQARLSFAVAAAAAAAPATDGSTCPPWTSATAGTDRRVADGDVGHSDTDTGNTTSGIAATAAAPTGPNTPERVTEAMAEVLVAEAAESAEAWPLPLLPPQKMARLVSGMLLDGTTSSDDDGSDMGHYRIGQGGRRAGLDSGVGDAGSCLATDTVITLRRSMYTMPTATSTSDVGGLDDGDGDAGATFIDLAGRMALGGGGGGAAVANNVNGEYQPDADASPPSPPAFPHTAPLLTPPRFFRQSWSPSKPLSHPPLVVPPGDAMATATGNTAVSSARGTATRPLTTTSQPPPEANDVIAANSRSAPLPPPLPMTRAAAATATAVAAATTAGPRGRFATPSWAPPGRQGSSGMDAVQRTRSAASSDLEHSAWLRAASGLIVGSSPPHSGKSCSPRYIPGCSPRQGPSYSPIPQPSLRPGGSYSCIGYSPIDVNEALLEAARWARAQHPLPPPPSMLQLPPLPRRRIIGGSGAGGGTLPDACGASAPLPYSYQHFRSRRDTADGSGHKAQRQRRQQEEAVLAKAGGSPGSQQQQQQQWILDERSPFVFAGRGAAEAAAAASGGGLAGIGGSRSGNTSGSGGGGSASRIFTLPIGGMRNRVSEAHAAQRWGAAPEDPGFGEVLAAGGGSGSAGGAAALRAALAGGGGRLGPLVKRRGPAAAVRRESQERLDRLVNEISARLRDALARKAQVRAAAAAVDATAAVSVLDGAEVDGDVTHG